jgi:hypothetical protein
LFGAKRLTTNGFNRQARRQTSLPLVLLLIRNVLGLIDIKKRITVVAKIE